MKNIRKYRAELGYTQKELAQKLEVSRQTVNCMENDPHYTVSKELMKKLTALFNCDIFDLCDIEDMLIYKPEGDSDALKEINNRINQK